MKGLQKRFGADRLSVLLLDDTDPRYATGKRQARLIARYGMGGYPLTELALKTRTLLRRFGQLSWGYLVIGPDGTLQGVNLRKHQLEAVVARSLAGRGRSVEVAPGAALTLSAVAPRLAPGETGEALLFLDVPPGWTVYGSAETAAPPTTVEVGEAGGLTAGAATVPAGAPGESRKLTGRVVLRQALSCPADAAPGTRTVKGVVRLMPCDADMCLPPMALPWAVEVVVRPKP